MLNKSLVIAALTSSASAATAAAAKPAAAAAAKPAAAAAKPAAAAAKPAAAAGTTVVITREAWEDILGRDLCDDWGTHSWETAAAEVKKQTGEVKKFQKEVDDMKVAYVKATKEYSDMVGEQFGRAAKAEVAAVAEKKSKDGLTVTLATDKVDAVTAVVGTSTREANLKKEKTAMDTLVLNIPKTWAKETPVPTTTDRDTKYTTLKGKTVAGADAGNRTDLKAVAGDVVTAAANLLTEQTKVANMKLDRAAKKLMLKAHATVPMSAGFTADNKAAQDKIHKADNLIAVGNLTKTGLTDQINNVSYLFRIAGVLGTGKYKLDTCESTANRTTHPLCMWKTTTAAGTWAWPTNYKCDTTGTAATCEMRGLYTPPQGSSTTKATTVDRIGLINMVETTIGVGDTFNAFNKPAAAQANGYYKTAEITNLGLHRTAIGNAQTAYKNVLINQYKNIMYNASCWKFKSAGNSGAYHKTNDYFAWCRQEVTTNDNTTGVTDWTKYPSGTAGHMRFHPLLQKQKTGTNDAMSYAQSLNATDVASGLASVIDDFQAKHKLVVDATKSEPVYVASLMKLWYAQWMRKALAAEEAYVRGELNTINLALTITNSATTGYNADYQTAAYTTAYSGTASAFKTYATFMAAGTDTNITDAEKTTGSVGLKVKALADAVTAMDKLIKEGTDIKDANTAWGTARTKYVDDLKAYNDALAAVADFKTKNASLLLPTVGSQSVLDAAKATQTAVNNAYAGLTQLKAYQAEMTKQKLAVYAPQYTKWTKANANLKKAKEALIKANLAVTAAKNGCHAEAFKDAQEDRKKIDAAKKLLDTAATKARTDYKKLSAFPAAATTGVTAGGLCAQDATTKVRPTCKEDKAAPLCCGAAQRFLKDGTKLVVETCQLATATTYTYYPVMEKTDTVAPTAETWRFQCISAAQKLAAAATAALAAGYMMA